MSTTATRPDKHTAAQQRLYRHLCKQLGLDDETRRLVTQRMCRRRSTRNLSKASMARLCNELVRLAGEKVGPRPMCPGGCSLGQARKIQALAEALGWSDNPDRLAGFLRRMTVLRLHVGGEDRRVAGSIGDAKSRPEDLTSAQAMRVIEGLKDMLARRRRAGE